MANLKNTLKELNKLIEDTHPSSLDNLINLVHGSGLVNNYGTGFHIVQWMGAIQGIKVSITGQKTTHYLPKIGSYGALHDIDKYIKAGQKLQCFNLDSFLTRCYNCIIEMEIRHAI